MARHPNPPPRPKGTPKPPKTRECGWCREVGHNSRRCPRQAQGLPRILPPKAQAAQARAAETRELKDKARKRQKKLDNARPEDLAWVPPEFQGEDADAGDFIPGSPEWCEDRARLIFNSLTPKQREYVLNPAKRKAALCGRRAGKTFGPAAAALVLTALANPDSLNVYITISRKVAKRLVWQTLIRFNKRFGLMMGFNLTDLEIRFANGSQIWVTGVTNEVDMEKLRGSAYHTVVVDECASFGPYFETLIEEIIEPALLDYDGSFGLIGTPSAACIGYFFEATTGVRPGWEVSHWTVMDNPEFPRWAGKENWRELAFDLLEATRLAKGWDENHPTYQREWLGRWIKDEGGLVYKFSKTRNVYDGLLDQDEEWQYVLGVDIGVDDATAFSLQAFSTKIAAVREVESWKQSGLTTDAIAIHIRTYRELYNCRIVMDTGGLGKMIVEEMRRRYKLPIMPAEKTAKAAFISLMNNDLLAGVFKVCHGSKWIAEAEILQWNEDRTAEDDRFENDLCDATLYAWREAFHWQKPIRQKAAVLPGQLAGEDATPEMVMLAEEREMLARQVKRNKKRLRGTWKRPKLWSPKMPKVPTYN